MPDWKEQKQRYDKLRQQHSLDIQQLMHEAKLNNMPEVMLQNRLDMMRKALDNNVKDINRFGPKNY